jgi:molecular chaperone GrpE
MARKNKIMKEKEMNMNEINDIPVVENHEKTDTSLFDNEDNNDQMSGNISAEQEILTVDENKVKDPLEEMTEKHNILNDKYIRLVAEYDNYRKRTLKEKMDIMKTAGEDIFVSLLPVVDNFERAMKAIEIAKDVDAIKEGINLIYTNFREFLKQRGVTEIESIDKELNTDLHDAITKIPAPNEEAKGKVVDVIEKGYMLKDKVIRFAKVVVGE